LPLWIVEIFLSIIVVTYYEPGCEVDVVVTVGVKTISLPPLKFVIVTVPKLKVNGEDDEGGVLPDATAFNEAFLKSNTVDLDSSV
jgi:hypothetical protein